MSLTSKLLGLNCNCAALKNTTAANIPSSKCNTQARECLFQTWCPILKISCQETNHTTKCYNLNKIKELLFLFDSVTLFSKINKGHGGKRNLLHMKPWGTGSGSHCAFP